MYNTWMNLRSKWMRSPDDGAGAGISAGGAGTPQPAGDPRTAPPATLDDALKDKAVQAEFDRRMQKGIETALNNAHQKWEEETRARETEAARLAKMTEEQRQEHLRKQKEDELNRRERDLQLREMKAQAVSTLAEKGLPRELADCLDYTDAEKCSASMDRVEKAFRDAVQAGVETRMKGTTPASSGGGADAQTAAVRAAMGLE